MIMCLARIIRGIRLIYLNGLVVLDAFDDDGPMPDIFKHGNTQLPWNRIVFAHLKPTVVGVVVVITGNSYLN